MHHGRVVGCNCGVQGAPSGIPLEDVEDVDERRKEKARFLSPSDGAEVGVRVVG